MKTSDYESRCGNCHACGHNWETTVFGGDDSRFCPHCGKNALQIVERTILSFEDAFSLPNEEDSVPDTE